MSKIPFKNAPAILATLAVAVAGQLLMTWMFIGNVANEENKQLEDALQTTLNTTVGGMERWIEETEDLVDSWSEIRVVRESVNTLLLTEEKGAFEAVTFVLKERISREIDTNDFVGYFVYEAGNSVLASDNGSMIGDETIKDQELLAFLDGLLDDADSNQFLISSRNHPSLAEPKGEQREIVVASRITQSGTETLLGILAVVIDPVTHFSPILQDGRMGESGETYAFNDKAQLLSQSRFEADLLDMGLTDRMNSGVLEIEIRDPGGDLTEGFEADPTVNLVDLPMTLMASDAIGMGSSEGDDERFHSDTAGYADYRGREVIGMWTWLEDANFGVTTELDLEEAQTSFRATRDRFRYMSAWTVFLMIALTGVFMRVRYKSALAHEEWTDRLNRRAVELEESRKLADAANEAKSAFLANMSHELRTPMNAIIGYTEMLLEDAEDLEEDDFSPDLKKIHAAGKHLLSLINDVLDLSKIEAGKMELYYENFEISPMIDDVASTISSLIAKNHNELKIERGDDLGWFYSDLTKVRQSLFNLLSNASKFTENGTITLSIIRETENEDDWMVFSVQDTGIGVPAEMLDKLFEEFTQADASTKRKYGGTGLGLTITQRFCEMLGGTIGIESEEGVGTTFTIRLPAKPAPTEKKTTPNLLEDIKSASSGKASSILVIDDDTNARDMMQRTLEREGYSVVTADSGPKGLDLARTIFPDLITLDVMMPGMDGWAVLRELKADKDLKNIPVVMVTMVSDRDLVFALGAVEHLTKPVDREALLTLIKKHTTSEGAGLALIVEDDELSRSVLKRTIEDAGWTAMEAENGAVGLERLDEQKPDVILLDLMMPVMDGFEFVHELKKRGDCVDIPVIVVTAKDLTVEDHKLLRGAVEVVMNKSEQTTDQLLSQVNEVVSKL